MYSCVSRYPHIIVCEKVFLYIHIDLKNLHTSTSLAVVGRVLPPFLSLTGEGTYQIYIHICVKMYVKLYIKMYINKYISKKMCIYTCIQMYASICIYLYMSLPIYIHQQIYVKIKKMY
jgi:hypothetical protein